MRVPLRERAHRAGSGLLGGSVSPRGPRDLPLDPCLAGSGAPAASVSRPPLPSRVSRSIIPAPSSPAPRNPTRPSSNGFWTRGLRPFPLSSTPPPRPRSRELQRRAAWGGVIRPGTHVSGPGAGSAEAAEGFPPRPQCRPAVSAPPPGFAPGPPHPHSRGRPSAPPHLPPRSSSLQIPPPGPPPLLRRSLPLPGFPRPPPSPPPPPQPPSAPGSHAPRNSAPPPSEPSPRFRGATAAVAAGPSASPPRPASRPLAPQAPSPPSSRPAFLPSSFLPPPFSLRLQLESGALAGLAGGRRR